MASYAQIAQKTFTIDREDGTSRTWQFTFDKKDGSAQTYEVPIIEDIEIIEGNRSDAPHKPFKTHQATFKVKGVDEPLIDEIAAAGLRDIRVTIEDTATSTVKFQGYVLKELTTYRLYNDVQEVTVNCYGGLADLDGASILFDSSQFGLNITLDQLADQIATVLDLDRELDIYTSLHHQGLSTSDPFPTDISYNEEPIVGEGDDATMLDVVKNVMTALGFQLFQRGGRLVMADLYDRFANSSAINKHESDGAGGYTNTSENVEVTLSQSNVIKGGEFKDLAPIIALQQRYSMTHREAAAFTDPSPTFESRGDESEHNMDFGLGLEGDIVSVTIDGDIVTSGPGSNVEGSVEFARLELQDFLSGNTFYFNPNTNAWVQTSTGWSQSFSFTGGGGIQEQPFSVNTDLPPVPEGLLAKIVLVTSCDVTVTTGSATDVTQTDYDNLDVDVEFADPDASVTHVFESSSAEAVGDTLQGNTFLGDEDLHTDNHAFQFNSGGVPTDTFNWISDTGNGRLGSVVSERAGAVVVGTGQEFTVLIRDTTDVDLLSVIKITDNDAVTRTCFPTEIRHRLSSGYYRVRVRETFNGVTSTSDTYGLGAVSGVGSSAGSGVTLGGGPSDRGGGLSVTEADSRYFRISQDLSEGNAATMRANIGLSSSDSPTFAGATVLTDSTSDGFGIERTDIEADWRITTAGGGQLIIRDISNSSFPFLIQQSELSNSLVIEDDGVVSVQNERLEAHGGAVIGANMSFFGSEKLRVVGASRLEGDVDVTGSLEVDGGLFAKEFTVEQTRVMFDFRMAPGGGKVESVSGSAGAETITLSSEGGATNPLTAGAIILIQERTGESSGTIIKQIYRKVDSIDGMDATLTDSGITWTAGAANDDTGSIEAGDNVTYEGHTSDDTLDHFIHYDIAGVDIPAIRFFDSVDDVGGGTEVMRVGGTGPDFGVAIGSQTFAETGIQAQYNGGVPRFFAGSGEDNDFSLSFDGSDDYIEADQVFDGVGDFTWEIDFKSTQSDHHGYMMQSLSDTVDGSTTNPSLGFRVNSTGTISLVTHDGTSSNNFATTGTYNDGEWYHAAIRRTGSTFSILVLDMQGNVLEEVDSAAGSYDTVAAGNKFFIGRFGSLAFDGNLDNPRAWNAFRSNSEIIADFNTELGGTEDNLLWYSEFDSLSSTIAFDEVGTNNGAINGATRNRDVPWGGHIRFNGSQVDILGPITATTADLSNVTARGSFVVQPNTTIRKADNTFRLGDSGLSFENEDSASPTILDFGFSTAKQQGHIKASTIEIDDDEARIAIIGKSSSWGTDVFLVMEDGGARCACVTAQSGSTPQILFSRTPEPDTGIGTPTGTTGTDGRYGIYVDNIAPNSGVHIENRTGGTRTFKILHFY